MPVSPKLFDDKWVGAIEKVGYKTVKLGIAIDREKNVLINWIDESDVFGLITFGQVDGLVKHLWGEMQFEKLSKLDMGAYRFKYAGMDFEGDKGQCRVSMSSYLEGMGTEKLF
uniref:Uncharacterized protein n=1 Tax=Chromera velia CCMP2878 TaxID=1169474 RepID=A0A0G4FRB2_9ALVE|eukprot:Cvel_18375.t1-p1 / transcript=Cvel_18375.t1 / gene=Cvel_18375 / organism=Chromera_velia_CCMP2878 / gene_product=hypothetical protein / transcript_product=hypothetical protein / location=Cvel_scaffold1519:16111-16446(-) / protein_length=112 / sequence_SO=supercontig / SO=protein_coding / is_pseudo=false